MSRNLGSKSPDDSLNKHLAKIPLLSKQLNKLADDASATVRQVEQYLEKSHVGAVNAKVEFECNLDFTASLRYERVGQNFRIAVSIEEHGVPPPEVAFHVRPFSDSSREIKLQAFQKLPDLIEQIVDNLERLIAKTHATTRIVNESIGLSPSEKQKEQSKAAS